MTVQRVIAILAAFLLGLHLVVHGGIGVGDAFTVLLLAVWLPAVLRYSGGWLLVTTGAVTAVWGWLLASGALADGYAISGSERLQTVATLLSISLGAGVLLWARGVIPAPVIGAAYGAGMVLNAVRTYAPSENDWKFIWAIPVSVLVLSLAVMTRRKFVGVAATALLAVVSALLDCRSYSAALLLATLLLVIAARRSDSTRKLPTAVVAGFVVALAGAVYYLGTSLLVSGYLGRDAQVRTIDQINTSGSVILGGRPEIAATWALMRHRPGGYGAGVIPQGKDILVAKGGLRGIAYDPNNGYVEKYMFGGHIELHSMFGDLWASFGIPGLVFTLLVVVVMFRSLSRCLARRTGDCLVIFLAVWSLWNVGFSPLASSASVLMLAMALALPAVTRTGARAGTSADTRVGTGVGTSAGADRKTAPA